MFQCNRDGYFRRYGAPGTPVDQEFYRVYDPYTGANDDDILVPWVNVPQTFAQMSPSEASPTGKPQIGYVMHAIDPQELDQLTRNFLNYDTNAIWDEQASLVTTSAINPYDTLTGDESTGSGYEVPGSTWTV